MELKERLLQVASHYGLSIREFERKAGLNRGNISNMTGALGTDKAAKIIAAFPDVNLYWLISGIGKMDVSSANEDSGLPFGAFSAEGAGKGAYGLDALGGGDYGLADSASFIYNGTDVRSGARLRSVPLYDLDSADSLSGLFAGEKGYFPADHIYIPGLPECDGAVRVRGNAMHPLLGSGDIVLYKRVKDMGGIVWGEMYVVSLSIGGEEEYVTVRYVNRSMMGEDHLLLGGYGKQQSPIEIPVASVRALAIVKASVRFNTMR